MMILGITGGMGSGKSIVCEVLRIYRIPVYDADKEAKALNDSSIKIREQLTALFGDDLYIEKKLDRQKLAGHIFGNRENLKAVNRIIHSELAKHFLEWTKSMEPHPIVAIDAAVLFEADFQNHVDKIITVTAPEEIRIKRVLKRDNLTKEQIIARMASQISEEAKVKMSHFTIINDNKTSILNQIPIILCEIENSLKDR